MKRKIFLLCCCFCFLFLKSSQAEISYPFKGLMDFKQNKFHFKINNSKENSFSMLLSQFAENQYRLSIDMNHFQTPFFEISTLLESSLNIMINNQYPSPRIIGKVWSRYTLINQKPINEVSGHFEVQKDKILLNSVVLGNVHCEGFLQMVPPYALNLSIKLSSIDLKDMIFFLSGEKNKKAYGAVAGQLNLKGVLDNIMLQGKFISQEGGVDNLRYNDAVLNIEGVYPNVDIVNSIISKADGLTFNVTGRINLHDRQHLVKQIKSLSRTPVIFKDESNLEWTFKRIISSHRPGMTELKYLKRKGDDFDKDGSEGLEMLGIEQKLKF